MSFLAERWEERAHEEHGKEDLDEIEKNRERKGKEIALKAYGQILALKNHDKLVENLVNDVIISALRYLKTIDELTYSRVSQEDKEARAEKDAARRRVHNALIDNLNILSRFCLKNNLDNNWRNMIGTERTSVTDWVKNVSDKLGYR